MILSQVCACPCQAHPQYNSCMPPFVVDITTSRPCCSENGSANATLARHKRFSLDLDKNNAAKCKLPLALFRFRSNSSLLSFMVFGNGASGSNLAVPPSSLGNSPLASGVSAKSSMHASLLKSGVSEMCFHHPVSKPMCSKTSSITGAQGKNVEAFRSCWNHRPRRMMQVLFSNSGHPRMRFQVDCMCSSDPKPDKSPPNATAMSMYKYRYTSFLQVAWPRHPHRIIATTVQYALTRNTGRAA